jgi:cytochrome c biogenesis protein CcmG/thiol:disulfide interchange protein DsbE
MSGPGVKAPEAKAQSTSGRGWIVWLPLIIIGVLGLLFAWGLKRGENTLIASQWINKPVPLFDLPPAVPTQPGLASRDLGMGRPHLLNIFASWCVPCKVESPQLDQLRARGVPVVGIAIRDRPQDLAVFLAENGNPYAAIGADERSEVQIALGSSGVPETFLVDGNGIIREQIQGIITDDMVPEIAAKLDRMAR